jgi:hypothetical protein
MGVNPVDPRAQADPVVEAYKAGVDRSLIRENLRRTVEERLEALAKLQEFAEELRRAGLRPAPGDGLQRVDLGPAQGPGGRGGAGNH